MALYPPIVASSMPAFKVTNSFLDYARIYFTLSNYTSTQLNDIRSIHISIRDQYSNNNKVKAGGSTGILVKNFENLQTEEDKMLNRYHVDILGSELTEGKFIVDKIYKVQLRFSTLASTDSTNVGFFTDNLSSFSLWSTVCIIKPISAPDFYINEFSLFEDLSSDSNINLILLEGLDNSGLTFTYPFADFSGVYDPKESSLTLKAWRIRILDSSYLPKEHSLIIDDFTLADSDWQFSSAYNYTLDDIAVSLKCSLPYLFSNSVLYKLLFEIKTRNDYTDNKLYTFKYTEIASKGLSGKLYTSVNEELGYIKIWHDSHAGGGEKLSGNIALRRSDSTGKFLNWKDLKIFQLTGNEENDYVYYDFTTESGVAYRYMLQGIDLRGRRGIPLKDLLANNSSATIADWLHSYLLLPTGNLGIDTIKQLKLKYDFQISSLKTNVFENKIDTIGSKYPFVRRNGNAYYRSFACTGTITSYMDNVDLFTSKQLLYDNVANIYNDYNYDKYKNSTLELKPNNYNYIYERKFREKVELFLYDSNIKLYKSSQLGNMLIKLMLVSLTPKNELGRLIYNFSATAYLIAEYSIENLNKYGFINVGVYDPEITFQEEKIGQLTSYDSQDNPNRNVFKAKVDIISGISQSDTIASISEKENINKAINGKISKDFTITYLRLTIESLPYLIILDNGILVPYDDLIQRTEQLYRRPIDEKFYQIRTVYLNGTNPNVYLGTLFYLNLARTKSIVISHPNNIYEFKDDNLLLSSSFKIIPAKDTIMNVDYVIKKQKLEDSSTIPRNKKVQIRVGQIAGTYNYTQLLINNIKFKYTQRYTVRKTNDDPGIKIKKYSYGVYSLAIDTLPNTVVYIRTKLLDMANRFVVNETGELNFDFNSNTKVEIASFKVYGINIDSNKVHDKGLIDNLRNVQNPKIYDLYKVDNKYYIFYKNKFYLSDKNEHNQDIISYDIKCPVDALIFYTTQVGSDYY